MGKRKIFSRAKPSRPKSSNRRTGGAFYLTRAKLHGKRLSRIVPLSREFCNAEMRINRRVKDNYPTTKIGKLRHSLLKRACYERFNPLKSTRNKLNILDTAEGKINERRRKNQRVTKDQKDRKVWGLRERCESR